MIQNCAIFTLLVLLIAITDGRAQDQNAIAVAERECPRHVSSYCGSWTVQQVDFASEQIANQHMKKPDEFEIVARGRPNNPELWLVPDGNLDKLRWTGQARRLTVIQDGENQRCLATKVQITRNDHSHGNGSDWHQLTMVWDQQKTKLHFDWSNAADDSEPTSCIFDSAADVIEIYGTSVSSNVILVQPQHGGRAHAN